MSLEKEIEKEEKMKEAKKKEVDKKNIIEENTKKTNPVAVKPPNFTEDSSDEELLQAALKLENMQFTKSIERQTEPGQVEAQQEGVHHESLPNQEGAHH